MASSLEGCVSSLRSSMQLLDSSLSILDSGVSDFPRLAKVLQTTRVSYFPAIYLITEGYLSKLVRPVLICNSISSSYPNLTYKPHNPLSFLKSDPKSTASYYVSQIIWTNSSAGSNH